MGSSAGTGVAAACLAGGFVIGCAAGYALGQPDRGRAAAAAAGEAAVSLKSSLSGAISDAVQHTRDVGIAAAASEAFECIRSKAKAGFGGSSGGSSGAAHDGGAAGATAAANCSAATPAAPAADGLNGRLLARGAGGESVSVRGEEDEVVAEESEGGEELSASMSGAATPVARNSSGGASTARSTSNAGSGSASSGERLRVAVVVRDDLLPQWGQGKAAAMISSCVVSWYRRCYKARSLRPQLLAWVSKLCGGASMCCCAICCCAPAWSMPPPAPPCNP